MINADFHTHSYYSSDSTELLRKMADSALEKGLKTLCLTEHHDPDYPTGEFNLDTEKYREELLRLKEEYSGKPELLFGVELGVMGYLAPRLREFVQKWDFDFVIASTHFVDGIDPYYPEYFEKLGAKNGVLRYFEATLENVNAFDNFDVYGHLDYVVRYSPEKKYNPVDYRELIDEILKKLISMGKGIEINSKGASTIGYCHPNPFILNRYKELGGEIVTVGSDAHDGSHISADFDKAEQALCEAGFDYYTIFRKRKPVFIKL